MMVVDIQQPYVCKPRMRMGRRTVDATLRGPASLLHNEPFLGAVQRLITDIDGGITLEQRNRRIRETLNLIRSRLNANHQDD